MPSKQSIIGDRYTFPSESPNSVISVSHFSLGREALKSRSIRLSAAGVISPLWEEYLARRGLFYGEMHFFHQSPDDFLRNASAEPLHCRFDPSIAVYFSVLGEYIPDLLFGALIFIFFSLNCPAKIVTAPRERHLLQ